MATIDDMIRGRRSVRRFEVREIPDTTLLELLDLARHAPSSMNGQPWSFVVLRDPRTKRRIATIKNAHCPQEKRDYAADFLVDAPVVVLIGVERARAHGRGRESGILAAGTLLLAAHARGLGGVFLTAYGNSTLSDELRAAVGLPDTIDPISLIPLGYPARTAEPKDLRPLVEMVQDGPVESVSER